MELEEIISILYFPGTGQMVKCDDGGAEPKKFTLRTRFVKLNPWKQLVAAI